MEASILTSVKKILGMTEAYTAFDEDVIMHINATFSVLTQLGVGPVSGFMLETGLETWSDFVVPDLQLNLVKTYLYLRVRMLFDPPTTSFLLEAMNKQISEYEWRLGVMRDDANVA